LSEARPSSHQSGPPRSHTRVGVQMNASPAKMISAAASRSDIAPSCMSSARLAGHESSWGLLAAREVGRIGWVDAPFFPHCAHRLAPSTASVRCDLLRRASSLASSPAVSFDHPCGAVHW
jgi:hypothetical protein